MLRSARHGNTDPRRGLVAVTAVLTGAVMTIAGLATGASATGGSHDGHDRDGSHRQDASRYSSASESTGAYVYRKRDTSKAAYWENSTQQYLVATWPGREYRNLTLEQVQKALEAEGIELCGAGWGVQEDQVKAPESLFWDTPAPSYPTATIGWPPITHAQHWNLEDFFAVPECASTPVAPSPTPTTVPSAPTSPAPTPSVTVPAVPDPPADTPTQEPAVTPVPTPVVTVAPAPEPAETSTAVPSAAPSPTASATSAVVTAVLPAPSSVETKAPAVVTQVLAAEPAGASLAQTGAAPIAGAVAAVLLVAGGGVLLLLRRRSATR
jgi:LPXTG-motif cell wall-anchored protein